MGDISNRAQMIPRSGIREVMELASHIENVIHLEVGEPSFGTPPHIIESAFEQAASGATRYTSNFGTPALRSAIASHYAKKWGKPVDPSQVLAAAGGVNAIAVTTYALIDPGDEVLIPDPGWPNYTSTVLLGGGVPVPYPMKPEADYVPTVEDIAPLVTDRTRILIVNTPSNPTGAVFPAAAVAELVAFARERDLFIISDEIYEELVFDGVHTPFAQFDTDERVITISGFSKTYAMTGWRLGYAIARPDVILAAGKLMEPLVSCASSVSQAAGVAALTGSQTAVEQMRLAYQRRRDLVVSLLQPAGLLSAMPHGAFYAMVDLRSSGLPSRDIAVSLLEEHHVACAPGSTFGKVAEGMIRISLASSEQDLTEGCARILAWADTHAS